MLRPAGVIFAYEKRTQGAGRHCLHVYAGLCCMLALGGAGMMGLLAIFFGPCCSVWGSGRGEGRLLLFVQSDSLGPPSCISCLLFIGVTSLESIIPACACSDHHPCKGHALR